MKYIVEFEDDPCMYEDEAKYYKCIQAPWWGLSERVIKKLTPYQPDIVPDTNVGNITNSCGQENDLIDRQAAIETAIEAADEWDGGTSFSRDGIIERRLKMIPADHVADIGKKAEGDCISRQAAIDALTHEWDGMVTSVFDVIKSLPSAQPATNCSEIPNSSDDTISRRAAIDALHMHLMYRMGTDSNKKRLDDWINGVPSVQPDRAIIDDCLHHIYKNISVHTATGGVIAIKYYMEKLYEEIYGEGERPWWMT